MKRLNRALGVGVFVFLAIVVPIALLNTIVLSLGYIETVIDVLLVSAIGYTFGSFAYKIARKPEKISGQSRGW